jgi:hypothetical protein
MPDQYVLPVAGEQIILQIGNGATPEVFSATCTINTTRGFTGTSKFSTTELADCTNPSNPAQTVRKIQSTDLSFDGAGVTDAPSILPLFQWGGLGQGNANTGNSAAKNCKIIAGGSGANGGFTISVALVMESIAVNGARGDEATFTGKWSQAAAPTSVVANA